MEGGFVNACVYCIVTVLLLPRFSFSFFYILSIGLERLRYRIELKTSSFLTFSYVFAREKRKKDALLILDVITGALYIAGFGNREGYGMFRGRW